MAIHSCGDYARWLPALKKINNLLMVDAAFSPQTDPDPNTPEAFRDAFVNTGIIVHARMVGDPAEVLTLAKRLWTPGLKLIVVTYVPDPVAQQQTLPRPTHPVQLKERNPLMDERLQKIYDSVLNGEMDEVAAFVQAALDAQIDPGIILNEGMISAMQEVGRLFEEGEYFVPEMLISARAMQTGLALLKPHLVQANVQSSGKVVIGTVKGDLHDIGKNLVAMMLEGAAFEIVDLGTDVSPDKFVEAVKTHQPADRRPVGAAHDDHAQHEDDDRSVESGRAARSGEGHHRRRARHRSVRARHRRGWFCNRCQPGGDAG